MVDHVEFDSPNLIERFLSYWRKTGSQRFGILYGRYEPYDKVPLGVKAIVSGIYEPPQTGVLDGIQLTLPNPDLIHIEKTALGLGLTQLGMIYTDTMDDGLGLGSVLCKRHSESYFLSSAECLFASQMQCQHPTTSKWSPSGKFGSRFVTCVLSGMYFVPE